MKQECGNAWRDYIPDLSVALPIIAGDGKIRQWLRMLAARVTAFDRGGSLLARAHRKCPDSSNPFVSIAQECNLTVEGYGDLPAGPLVVVANHPTGPMDGISYAKWLLERRSDTLIFTTDALVTIPSFRPVVIGLSLYGDKSTARGNAKALRRAMQHLSRGGCVAAFPAGTISWKHADGVVRDGVWLPTVFEIALRCAAPVACVHIEARHGALMEYLLSLHAAVRTFLLGRAFLRGCGTTHRLELRGILQTEDVTSATEFSEKARGLVESAKSS
jgi:hypothetical protein